MAQTKIKAGLFEGIIGNGTDGYFLMSNGDGTMAWSSIIVNPTITRIAYPGSVTAADPAGGETITVTGTGFKTGATVTVGGTAAPAVSYVSATQITFTTPAKAAGDYDIVVTNTDTGSATYINGISYNGIPSWTTAAGSLGTFASNTTISTITLQATEPDAGTITFNITNGALPTGLSLTGANIDGTTSILNADTLYTFTVTATDDENQATPRTFTITVQKEFVSTENFTINTYTGNGSTQTIEGKIGTAADFNGLQTSSASYINIPSSLTSTTCSVSFWMNSTIKDSNQGTMFDAGGGSSGNTGFSIVRYATTGLLGINFTHGVAGQNNSFSGTTDICDGSWHHICLVLNSDDTFIAYLDGSSHITGTRLYWTVGDTHNLSISRLGTNASSVGASSYDGKIDQFRIFNKALSSSEVTTLYGENNTSSTKSTTDIFDDGSGVALYEFEKGAIDTGGVSGYIGSGGIFNGSSSKIELPNNAYKYTTFTVSLFAHSSDWTQSLATLYSFYDNDGANGGGFIGINNDVVCFFGAGGTSSPTTTNGTTILVDNTWYHILLKVDGTSVKVYLDGTEEISITLGSNFSYRPTHQFTIGARDIGANTYGYFNGKIDQVRIFNTAVSDANRTTLGAETSASATKSTTDIFSDSSGVALYELEGNANDDSTKNPAVFEQLNTSALAYSENDTKIAGATAGNYKSTRTTESKTSGKYYVEMKYLGSSAYGSSRGGMGIVSPTGTLATYLGTDAESYAVFNTGNIFHNNAVAYSYNESSFATNDIIMFALDMDNQKFYLGKNNSWFGSDNPATGTGGVSISGSEYYIGAWAYNTSDIVKFYFKSSLQNYTAPTGFSAWSEDNFIYNGTATNVSYKYDGTPTNVSFVGTSFQPDLVWMKQRSYVDNHYWIDSIRGAGYRIFSNLTSANLGPDTNRFSSLDTNGFTLGSDASVNQSGQTYVAWMWKAGGTAVSNTNGTITSTVSANQDAGFSIVKYTGNSTSNSTFGHGLSQTPEMFIIKNISNAGHWTVWHKNLNTNYGLYLSTTNSQFDSTNYFWAQQPTSTTISIMTDAYVNASNNDYVAYCFHSVSGYQKVGSYSGSNSNLQVTTGFQPRFVLLKNIDAATPWAMFDNLRSGNLYANDSAAESDTASNYISFNSTGFELVGGTGSYINIAGYTWIYLAIA